MACESVDFGRFRFRRFFVATFHSRERSSGSSATSTTWIGPDGVGGFGQRALDLRTIFEIGFGAGDDDLFSTDLGLLHDALNRIRR